MSTLSEVLSGASPAAIVGGIYWLMLRAERTTDDGEVFLIKFLTFILIVIGGVRLNLLLSSFMEIGWGFVNSLVIGIITFMCMKKRPK